MNKEQFLKMLHEAKQGKPKSLNNYFKQLFEKVNSRLVHLVPQESDVTEVFAEVIARFWILFVEGEKALPNSNIDGYIFTMARMLCLEQHRKQKRHQIIPIQSTHTRKISTGDSDNELAEERSRKELQYEAMQIAIAKMEEKCRKLFAHILKLESDKPKELWKPLGYKNARTLSSVKNQCLKKLKKQSCLEFDTLSMNKNQFNNVFKK